MRLTRERAVEAAIAIASGYGIKVRSPLMLRSTNNTVVHLGPAPIVAKIGTGPGARAGTGLTHELVLAVHLAGLGAPVVEPSPELPARVYHAGDLAITFWRYYEQPNDGEIPCYRSANALREFHTALNSYPGHLPDFRDHLLDARELLGTPGLAIGLKDRDRAFLISEHARIRSELATASLAMQPVHGSPHRFNLLDTGTRVLLIDLETTCRGPLELDIAYIGCEDEFSAVDRRLLALFRNVVSLNVAVSCWTQMDAVPELAWHAGHHLRVLRARARERSQTASRTRG